MWWVVFLVLFLVVAMLFLVAVINFKNTVLKKKEDIDKAKSRVRILKAKYLQVLRKVGATQKDSNEAQGEAYYTANRNGGGRFIGGAFGAVDSNFEEVGNLVVSLADEYESAQQSLNNLVNQYNIYISAFPRVILTKMFRYKKENYVDSGNLASSTKLSGFDDKDI